MSRESHTAVERAKRLAAKMIVQPALAPVPCSDAEVIVADGYYRIKAEREELLKIIRDLCQLVQSHHTPDIMRYDLEICPVCAGRLGTRTMMRADRALYPLTTH